MTEQKPEMTKEEFADKWAEYTFKEPDMLSDLRSVIRGELKEFQKYDVIDAELQRAKEIHHNWPDDL